MLNKMAFGEVIQLITVHWPLYSQWKFYCRRQKCLSFSHCHQILIVVFILLTKIADYS